MLISVLIPTFNRSESLIKNLTMLDKYINDLSINNNVDIIISDNGSELNECINIKSYLEEHKSKIEYYYHENIGYENNILFLISKCTSKYFMLLGDDDFLDFNLFSLIYKYVKTDKYNVIVGNFYLINENGERISEMRDPIERDRIHKKGDLVFSLKGHQLSCLTFKNKYLLKYYNRMCPSNVYPTVFLVGCAMALGDGLHITRFPYQNTQLEKKNFDYSFDNLFEDICLSFEALPFKSRTNRIISYHYFLQSEKDRIINRNTFFKPYLFIYRLFFKYKISRCLKIMTLVFFLIEIVKLPFRYIKSKII